MYTKSLAELIESFKSLPGIGERTAERLAFFVLDMDEELVINFSDALINAKKNISKCEVCNNLTEDVVCNICSSQIRNVKQLCVVEDSRSVSLFEKIGTYTGLYFVLDGLISPIDGVNPEDIGIEKLMRMIEKHDFDEIILAVKPSIEGETTSLYIKKILENMNLKVTRIASGVPVGADMEYIDKLTLMKAFSERKELE